MYLTTQQSHPCYMSMRNSYTYVPRDMYNYFYTSTVQDGKALGRPKGPWMREGIGKSIAYSYNGILYRDEN